MVFLSASLASADVLVLSPAYSTTEAPGYLPLGHSQGGRLQTVFDASLFGTLGDITITGITFRADSGNTVATGTTGMLIMLDAITPGAGHLSTTFARNLNRDFVTVYNAPYTFNTATTGAGPRPFDSTVVFSTPFNYTPSSGLNLLLDLQTTNPHFPGLGNSFIALDSSMNTPTPGVSSVFATNPGQNQYGLTRSGGLVIQFDYTTATVPTLTPEPGTLTLLGAGIGLLLVATARRKRYSTR